MANLKTELQGIYQHLQKLAPSDGGLQVERAESKAKKRKLPNPAQPPKKMAKIPKTRSKRSKFSGRHGSHAAMMRKTFQVHVDVPKLNHVPLANTQRAAASITDPATSNKLTASSNTTPATATQVHSASTSNTMQGQITTQPSVSQMPAATTVMAHAKHMPAAPYSLIGLGTVVSQVTAVPTTVPATATQTPIAPLTVQASVAHMPPTTTVLTDAKQLLTASHSVKGLTAATHITVAPITVPATATHTPIEPSTQQPNAFQVPVSTVSSKQAPASATAVPMATTQIPAALTTVHITTVQVPAAPPTAVSTAATNVTTVQPTAAPTTEGPTSKQAASCTSVEVSKIPNKVSGDPIAHDKICSSSHGKPPILIINDDDYSQDSVTWLTIDNSTPCDPDAKLTLYKESRDGILKTTYWLHDSEIHAGQILLKEEFPHVDGLQDPAIRGELVLPAAYEFVQVVNVGRHWACISTIGCQTGTIKVFDSLYRKPNSILLDHAFRMVVCPQDTVTFLNEKVQRQLGSSDCGLFALAFATDLCHGLDPSTQSYNQKDIRQHYVHCLESRRMTPFPKTNKRVQYHISWNKTDVPIFCLGRLPNEREYVQCSSCHGWYHLECAYQVGNQFQNTVEVSKLLNKQSKGRISSSSKLHLCTEYLKFALSATIIRAPRVTGQKIPSRQRTKRASMIEIGFK